VYSLRWTEQALTDFEQIQSWIASHDQAAAVRHAHRVVRALRLLKQNPLVARKSPIEGVREWPVAHSHALIAFRVHGDQLQILHVFDSRQDWQARLK
jgi:plasmid stabilization system protein ParE